MFCMENISIFGREIVSGITQILTLVKLVLLRSQLCLLWHLSQTPHSGLLILKCQSSAQLKEFLFASTSAELLVQLLRAAKILYHKIQQAQVEFYLLSLLIISCV